MNDRTFKLNIIPEDMEKQIFSFVCEDVKSFEEYERLYIKNMFKPSLMFLDRNSLEKYIISKFTHPVYNASCKNRVGDNYGLASMGFPINKNGCIMKSTGRYDIRHKGFNIYIGMGKIFLNMDSIIFDKEYNNLNKKQRKKLWLFSKILLTDIQCEK
jgi:hypothetical protein